MLLNNAQVCLNMPETELKITVQAKKRLASNMVTGGASYKNDYSLELFSKDFTIYLAGI